MADYSYIGAGKIYLAPLTSGVVSGAARHIGNVSALEFSVDIDKKDLLDFTNCAGGKTNSYSRIQGVTANMSIYDISAENLALAFRGTTSAHTGATQTSEAQTAYVGGFIKTDYVPDTDTIVVKDVTDVTTYTEGTDYEVTPGGITIIDPAPTIVDTDVLHITYTSQTSSMIEALTSASNEFKLVFAGLNKAQECEPLIIDVFRFKPDPAQAMPFIGDEFAVLELSGEVLIDDSVTTAGLSQYFTVDMI